MYQLINVSFDAVAKPVESEKQNPCSAGEFQDFVRNHPYHAIAQNAFKSFYHRVVPNYYVSRLHDYPRQQQRDILQKFKDKIPEQEDDLQSLYVSSFIRGSQESPKKSIHEIRDVDYPGFAESFQSVCERAMAGEEHPYPRAQQKAKEAVLRDMGRMIAYAAAEGNAYAAEQGWHL